MMSQVIHLRLPDEVLDMIDKCFEGKNMTDKIRNYLSSPILNREYLKAEKKLLEIRLIAISNALKSNIFVDLGNLTDAERKYLEETEKVVARDPKYLYGRREAYNNKFNKHLTTKEFRLLLHEFKNGS